MSSRWGNCLMKCYWLMIQPSNWIAFGSQTWYCWTKLSSAATLMFRISTRTRRIPFSNNINITTIRRRRTTKKQIGKTIYSQFAISCNQNPSHILDQVRSQLFYIGGQKLEVKQIQALTVFPTHHSIVDISGSKWLHRCVRHIESATTYQLQTLLWSIHLYEAKEVVWRLQVTGQYYMSLHLRCF